MHRLGEHSSMASTLGSSTQCLVYQCPSYHQVLIHKVTFDEACE